MSCRQFDRDIAEWVAGRLPADRAAAMKAHADACPACARLAKSEREMRELWGALPAVREPRNLWPSVEARIAAPRKTPSRWFIARGLAYAGALAGVTALCAVMWPSQPTSGPRNANGGPGPGPIAAPAKPDEGKVLQLVSEIRRLPDSEGDPVLAEPGQNRPSDQALLLGLPGE